MMKDAIRNVRDLLIDPYRAFMRMKSVGAFNREQYILYIVSLMVQEIGKKGIGTLLEIVYIGISIFLMGWIYKGVVSACGGRLDYWRSLNAQVCMGTLANVGNYFEIWGTLRLGESISFAVSIYCIYLHLRCIIVMSGAGVKRTLIVYIAIFAIAIAVVYVVFGLLAGLIINGHGYIS